MTRSWFWEERYAAYARELAQTERDETRKAELLQIAANCDVVPAQTADVLAGDPDGTGLYISVTSELNPWDSVQSGDA